MKKIIITAVLLLMIFSISACDVMFGMFQPDYAGVWSLTQTSDFADTKIMYEFSRSEYQYTMYFVVDDVLIDLTTIKGLASGTDTGITMTPVKYKEIELAELGETTFENLEWTDFPEDTDSQTMTWAIDGQTLTLTDADGNAIVLTQEVETTE